MNKKVFTALSALMISLSLAPEASAMTNVQPEPVKIRGTVIGRTDSTVTVDNQMEGTYKGEFVILISGDTDIIDWESREEAPPEVISEGEMISAVISPIVTASLPPQSTASLIYSDYMEGWTLLEGEAGSTSAVWAYYDENGSKVKGWLQDKGEWYYMDPETGVMQRGFIQVNGSTYYMQQDGSMLTEPRLFMPDETGAIR